MLELFIRCPVCKNRPYEERASLHCETCAGIHFIPLTPEVCPEHEWIWYGSFDIRQHCRYCGKLAAEVTA